MKRYYNVTGEDRKRMVSIIGEVIGEKPYYLRMPIKQEACGLSIVPESQKKQKYQVHCDF